MPTRGLPLPEIQTSHDSGSTVVTSCLPASILPASIFDVPLPRVLRQVDRPHLSRLVRIAFEAITIPYRIAHRPKPRRFCLQFSMANRQLTRRILISIVLAIVFCFILFVRSEGPPSPAIRAPGHLDKYAAKGPIARELLRGEVVMPHLGNETAKADLGRATWKYFHTMMARYPEHPTEDQQETLRSFVYLFSRLYPCGECASNFQHHLSKYPPQVSSRNAAAGWACFIHNEVNTMLHKPIFDCNKLGDFYDCGCEDEKDGEKGGSDLKKEGKSPGNNSEVNEKGSPPVEISNEPPTRG